MLKKIAVTIFMTLQEYHIQFHNDMGHLMIADFFNIPENIRAFAYNKIKNKILYAKDNARLGCRFYILKNGLNDIWSYNFNDCKITIYYDKLDKFEPNSMVYV